MILLVWHVRKRLKRKEFWYCELCTIYPYDNVRDLRNVSSKKDDRLVGYGLFNKSRR